MTRQLRIRGRRHAAPPRHAASHADAAITRQFIHIAATTPPHYFATPAIEIYFSPHAPSAAPPPEAAASAASQPPPRSRRRRAAAAAAGRVRYH